jgi:putative GTP pyrophosphokinase
MVMVRSSTYESKQTFSRIILQAAAVPDLRESYENRRPVLEQVAARLEVELTEHFEGVPRIDRISFRTKGIDSFVEKATARKIDPPYEHPLAEIEDQIAGRVLVLFAADVADAVRRVNELLTPVEYDHKRPTRYNEFDYESVHGVYTLPPPYLPPGWNEHEDMPQTFEMQVRTLFQHAYAETQHDLDYKSAIPVDDAINRELAWIAAGCWGGDQALERVRSLVPKSTDHR